MKKLYSLLLTALFALPAAHVHATDYTQGLSIWFDTPNTLQGKAISTSGKEKANRRAQETLPGTPMPTGSRNHCPLETEASEPTSWAR
mgnify:CR=1 FL=1